MEIDHLIAALETIKERVGHHRIMVEARGMPMGFDIKHLQFGDIDMQAHVAFISPRGE